MTYSINFYQGELNVGGSRTILGKEELPKEGYKVVCFKLEENCNANVLMTPNAHYAGKTVLSYGLLDESTNKVTYFQQELECNFDEMYENARKIPTPAPATTLTATNEASTYSTADISSLRSMEVDYMVLMQSTPTKYQLDDGSDPNSRSADSYPGIYKTVSVDDPVEPCPMDNNNQMSMGDFLDYMIENDGYNTNMQSCRNLVYPVPDAVFRSGPLWELISFSNFKYCDPDPQEGEVYILPYAYFAYGMSTSVPGIRLTQILALDITHNENTNSLNDYSSLKIEIRHTGLVVYSSETGQMEYIDGGNGAGKIEITSAKSYFRSTDIDGVFNYRYCESYRGAHQNSSILSAGADIALSIAGVGWVSDILEDLTFTGPELMEGKEYEFDKTKEMQVLRYDGGQIREIYAIWGGNTNYFYNKRDFWTLKTRRNNMSSWVVGFTIEARMYVYMTF